MIDGMSSLLGGFMGACVSQRWRHWNGSWTMEDLLWIRTTSEEPQSTMPRNRDRYIQVTHSPPLSNSLSLSLSTVQVNTLTALIQRGAPTHQEDYEGLKPLDLAKDNQHNECIQLLFKTISPSLLVGLKSNRP